jgi:glycosyltransferase involved in cell wall biosynthesis
MNLPLISVLIPTFNVAPFVEEAIRSIMNQTYKNLEIIIVDDGSSDGTFSILEKLSVEDARIRLYRNKVNLKIVKTLNYALSLANGSFIARMDGDDVSLPTRLERQYQFMLQHEEFDLVGLNVMMVDEGGKEIHIEEYISDFRGIKEVSKYVSPIPHFWLAKREVYNAVGDYRIPSVEDYDFLLRALDKGIKMSNVPETLYLQRIRNGNTATASGLNQRKAISYIKKLKKERAVDSLKGDSYSDNSFKNALKSSRIERKFYGLSSKYHYKYLVQKQRSKAVALLSVSLAVFFSPKHKLLEFYNRFHYRRVLNKYKSSL